MLPAISPSIRSATSLDTIWGGGMAARSRAKSDGAAEVDKMRRRIGATEAHGGQRQEVGASDGEVARVDAMARASQPSEDHK